MTLAFSRLRLDRRDYGEAKGSVTGEITFDGERGQVTLNLSAGQCARLFEVIADAVVATAYEAAADLLIEAKATAAITAPTS